MLALVRDVGVDGRARDADVRAVVDLAGEEALVGRTVKPPAAEATVLMSVAATAAGS